MAAAMRALLKMLAPCLAVLLAAAAAGAGPAGAQYFRRPSSNVDPRIMQIDETTVLGNRIDAGTVLVDHEGKELVWKDLLGAPLILVLGYYTCDGSCSIINQNLRELMRDVTLRPGRDFRIVTLSFDRRDAAGTTRDFRKALALDDELAKSWTFATFRSEDDLKRQTERIGFKFFWSPEDRIFLHPGAFLFFSGDGRLVRVLYQQDVTARDIELATFDARQGNFKPNEIVNLALSVCFSYSYADGRYVLNLPLFIGAASFLLGIGTLFGSMAVYRSSRNNRQTTGENNHA